MKPESAAELEDRKFGDAFLPGINRRPNFVSRVTSKVKRVGVYNSIAQVCIRLENIWFDFRYGVNTHGIIPLSKLNIESRNVEHGVQYQPIPIGHLRKVLHLLSPTPEDVLVDFGSGKGNVLMLSSMYQFRKVVGIEFSESLCAVARKNVERFKAHSRCNIEINCVDACDYKGGGDETIFYFFNPFGRVVMEKVIDNIRASIAEHPRRVRIVYYNLRSQSLGSGATDFALISDGSLHGIPFQIYESKNFCE